jgi:hypothetical protein
MKLHSPFIISSALCPALKIGPDATLSLLKLEPAEEGRTRATFELRTPTFTYNDDELRSGCQGFQSVVEVFNTFLSFMAACGESMRYPDGENRDIFPPHVAQWCEENLSEIEMLSCDLQHEDGRVNHSLIE